MPQFHQRVDAEGRTQRWNVDRLIELAHALPRITVALSSLHEFDEVYWFDATFPPTCRAVVEHAQRIQEVDLAYPNHLVGGWARDGWHASNCESVDARAYHGFGPPDGPCQHPHVIPQQRAVDRIVDVGLHHGAVDAQLARTRDVVLAGHLNNPVMPLVQRSKPKQVGPAQQRGVARHGLNVITTELA